MLLINLYLFTSFSASISLNDLILVSKGTIALSLAARTSASIAASFPISIVFLFSFSSSSFGAVAKTGNMVILSIRTFF